MELSDRAMTVLVGVVVSSTLFQSGCTPPAAVLLTGVPPMTGQAATEPESLAGDQVAAFVPAVGGVDEFLPPYDSRSVDPAFEAARVAAGAPGVSVAVIKGGRVRWAKGYGMANIETRQPATQDTVYMLGSISKIVVAVALAQLISEPARGLTLDSDISASLPFPVRNPGFPGTPITFRMVLTHTASILDREESIGLVDGDTTVPLASYVGEQVASANGWMREAPGTRLEYSNTGFTLAGLLVEQLSGMSLETYTQQRICAPIAMPESSWYFRQLDMNNVAMPYQLEGNALVPQGWYSWASYPAGHFHTSAVQLARFLAMIARGGEFNGNRILAATVVRDMGNEQVPTVDRNQGLAFQVKEGYDGRLLLGHSGGFLGCSTDMWYDPATGAGYVLLTNGGAYYNEHAFQQTGEYTIPSQTAAMESMNTRLLQIATEMP